ncbi:hypothetical protein VFPPC_03993 [Pochonia chlamydosporia 170]|uniref:Uncharacterized protein n=1 Tax=Pochonia chlamydosporia 170 TaxID=1380566 RepID=A0A179FPW1_METCM|nr:hypothetical protein VFPPC_03993 [Pochonia chlamydosporia 170]OAQ67624.2 hypothetical protein VFPPC_03993 [Pochonia chlamydosporia 170]
MGFVLIMIRGSSLLLNREQIIPDHLSAHPPSISNMACTAPNSLSYYSTSNAILSTIGICYVLVGIMVAGIGGKVTALLAVPILSSIGCAIANGLAYYGSFVGCPLVNQAVAFLFCHFSWTVSAMFVHSVGNSDLRSRTPFLWVHHPTQSPPRSRAHCILDYLLVAYALDPSHPRHYCSDTHKLSTSRDA